VAHEERAAAHARRMEQMAWEMEAMQTEQKLQQLQEAAERRSKERGLRRAEEETRRAVKEAQLRQQLVKALPGSTLPPNQERINPTLYEPQKGFLLYVDFVSGVPRAAKQCGAIYGVYDGNAPRVPAKLLPLATVDGSFSATLGQHCIFGIRRSFVNIPASVGLRLVLEPQITTSISSDPTKRPPTRPLGAHSGSLHADLCPSNSFSQQPFSMLDGVGWCAVCLCVMRYQ
jgi:hypothetical protein